MQKIILTGNLGSDATLQASKNSGAPYTKFSIASSKEKITTWYSGIVFGKRAESLLPFLKKGAKVLIEGELKSSAYLNKNNEPVCDLCVMISQIEFIGSKTEQKDSYFQSPVENAQPIEPVEWNNNSSDGCPF